jgi:hypothetical protein
VRRFCLGISAALSPYPRTLERIRSGVSGKDPRFCQLGGYFPGADHWQIYDYHDGLIEFALREMMPRVPP